MRGRAFQGLVAALMALALCACVPGAGLAPKGGKAAADNALTGGEIEVTSLDAPPAKEKDKAKAKAKDKAKAKAGSGGQPEQDGAGVPQGTESAASDARAPGTDTPRPKERPKAEAAEKPDAGTEPETPPVPKAADPVPEAEKSAAQVACERKKGVWAEAGNGLRGCVTDTRDGGKVCRSAGQCEGDCLARSGTCAPFTPLFGCNEVLDDAGRRMTQCLD